MHEHNLIKYLMLLKNVNKVSSAVRTTHLSKGIIVKVTGTRS